MEVLSISLSVDVRLEKTLRKVLMGDLPLQKYRKDQDVRDDTGTRLRMACLRLPTGQALPSDKRRVLRSPSSLHDRTEKATKVAQ